MDFLTNYKNFENFSEDEKKELVFSCVKFYEDKAINYILANLSNDRKENFKKEDVKVEFLDKEFNGKKISFGDNIVYVDTHSFEKEKKLLFFEIAQNTICAVFSHIFSSSEKGERKTSFSNIANGFLASITCEFARGESFENDMMQGFESVLVNDNSIELGL